MDNVSISKANSLYWLGRYTERAYKMAHIITEFYDRMVDYDLDAYKEFCARLGINIENSDRDSFTKMMISDFDNSNSIAFSIAKAYDNSIILREQIDTESVAYIQLAYNHISRLFNTDFRIYDLQKVIDDLMCFWGAVDDYIIDDYVRDAIKTGKYVERIDLFCRFDRSMYKIEGCQRRLLRYISHLDTEKVCSELPDLFVKNEMPNIKEIEQCIGKLFK